MYRENEREREREREENPPTSPILSASALQVRLSTLYKGNRQEIKRIDIMRYGIVLYWNACMQQSPYSSAGAKGVA